MARKGEQLMRHREPCLVIIVGSVAWLLIIGCGAASAQKSRLYEFGPDAAEFQPQGGAVKATRPLAGAIEPEAGSWRPWVLTSGRELRLPPPPNEQSIAAELRELKKLGAGDDAAIVER